MAVRSGGRIVAVFIAVCVLLDAGGRDTIVLNGCSCLD